jgi:hypothetical protein
LGGGLDSLKTKDDGEENNIQQIINQIRILNEQAESVHQKLGFNFFYLFIFFFLFKKSNYLSANSLSLTKTK